MSVADARIYARAVTGPYASWRIVFVFLTQALFYGLPWLQWDGRQAVLFDLGARRFYLFGLVLWPQDVVYLAVLLVISALGLFLFTALAGRLFCGYACPQTVYSEIFAWIERKVEGDRAARQRLDQGPWTARKLRLKAAKHALWLGIAWWTGSTFIGYFAPIRQLAHDLFTLQLGPWQWFWIVFYSVATWGNAGFLRESVCKYMCPYARFQSVMVDRDTFVVTYDKRRGEPRGGRSRHADAAALGLGDCVDCHWCVQVCPTGIDIRDGLQYMCIGCGACVDACNDVMKKMQYAPGLIRYASERAVDEGLSRRAAIRRLLRPRTMVYGTLLAGLVVALMTALWLRPSLRMDVIRDRGVLGREVAGGMIENVYRLQFMNTSGSPVQLALSADGLDGLALALPDGSTTVRVDALDNKIVAVVARAPAAGAAPGAHRIVIHARGTGTDGAAPATDEAASFFIPQ
ncbi:cytochrome c oxidase accessory protein CcoG [Bordetella genomosp. 11]|uniref:Cytochrome c oxidase accessory protein CcoG n=1 Tax=Bordetella genomosp. 11 TaxID=1416808 RepID=A0A261UIP9_9BORD|nr:cytochrome c oxidase accessory protein CcoG [Bordetella genomosp. 11]